MTSDSQPATGTTKGPTQLSGAPGPWVELKTAESQKPIPGVDLNIIYNPFPFPYQKECEKKKNFKF